MCPPFSKKGNKADPSNYRPISLTCVFCKVLEHIVASNLSKHFTALSILYELQHRFREDVDYFAVPGCSKQTMSLARELGVSSLSHFYCQYAIPAFIKYEMAILYFYLEILG